MAYRSIITYITKNCWFYDRLRGTGEAVHELRGPVLDRFPRAVAVAGRTSSLSSTATKRRHLITSTHCTAMSVTNVDIKGDVQHDLRRIKIATIDRFLSLWWAVEGSWFFKHKVSCAIKKNWLCYVNSKKHLLRTYPLNVILNCSLDERSGMMNQKLGMRDEELSKRSRDQGMKDKVWD